MARRTHEELVEALRVFDMSIENPPSKTELSRRWKELLSKVHSDTPGGSEFLSKQLNVARDIIKEWLDAGRPTRPGARESAADQARERARREREAEAARAKEGAAEEDVRKGREQERERESAKEYAEANWEKHFRPGGAGGSFEEYDRRKRRQGLIKRGLKCGSAIIVVGGLYIGASSDWGSTWPYIGERPQQIIICWDKIALPYEFAKQKANEEIASRRLWHGIWWGGYPVIHVKGTKWVKPKKQVIIETSLEFFSSRDEMFSQADCYKSWRQIQVVGIDEIRRKLGK